MIGEIQTDLSTLQFKPKQMSPLNLAFIGDGIFELMVRTRLIEKGSMPVGKLHSLAIKHVCAKSQARALDEIFNILNEEEIEIFKRGRNANSVKPPKNQDPLDYRKATGLEALFGFLYLSEEKERIIELFNIIWNYNVNNT
ncbi:MAG: ribonuclease III domain-containing protein [Oscillospiraceae bacterium]